VWVADRVRTQIDRIFIAIGKHSAETCLGGVIRPDKAFMEKLSKSIGKSGTKPIEGNIDGPGHTFYLIV
jgi:hypothetical protein